MRQGQQRDANRVSLYGRSTLDSAEPFPPSLLHIKSFSLAIIVKEETVHNIVKVNNFTLRRS